ncbi:recombinase family protein [Sphingobium yanoikuyae]|uniref:recombinase family protein n=1 Tax=Sphingobium yanoikuyae TaxID=13690 RepID=UPI0009B857C5|nr:recombinase family protein [Sphingobium yanoikuyae]MDV3480851.1 recombinase family protein [Sphingobium yanoikuyae]
MNLIAYYRVSTDKQGRSGLGLAAQESAVQQHAASGGHRIVAQFVEVESGKRADRPQLAAALAACRLHRATLCIAKLDRLARNLAFVANLMESGTDFVAVDNPTANRLTIHLLAAIAEHEREMISQRTKAALAAAKARGVRLGNPNGAAALLPGCHEAAAKSATRRQEAATKRAFAIAPVLVELAESGIVGAAAQARELNLRGIPAPKGGVWYPALIRRMRTRRALDQI